MIELKVLVCGGREFVDYQMLCEVLDVLLSTSLDNNLKLRIIHGAARGADTMAGQWAALHNIAVNEYPADWNKFGKAAGHIRNKQMLDEGKPDLIIAFPGGKGTANMIKQAKEATIDVFEVGRKKN